MLELDLEKPYEFDGETGRAGDADARVFVSLEHFFDVALGDDVAHRGAAVAGHDNATGVGHRDDRRAVWCIDRAWSEGALAGHHVWRVHAEEVGEGADAGLVERGRQPT